MTRPRSMPEGVVEVLGLVDLHWSPSRELMLPALSDIDLVLLGGDLTHFRGAREAAAIVDRVRAGGSAVLAVCGNCDRPEIETYLAEEEIDLDRRAREILGIRFVGLSGGLPFGGCPYERSEDDFAAACEQAFAAAAELSTEGPTVLVSHQPPYGTACDRARGRHVGSRAVRRAIERHRPDLVLCGHIHEASGLDRIGESQVVNPGPAFGGYSLRFRVGPHGLSGIELSQP